MGLVWAHYRCFLYSFCTWEMYIPLLGGQLPMTSRLWRRRFLDFTHSQRAFRCHIDLRAVCGFTFTVLVRVRGPARVYCAVGRGRLQSRFGFSLSSPLESKWDIQREIPIPSHVTGWSLGIEKVWKIRIHIWTLKYYVSGAVVYVSDIVLTYI